MSRNSTEIGEGRNLVGTSLRTIDINNPGAMANKTVGRFENVVNADAQSNLLNHLEKCECTILWRRLSACLLTLLAYLALMLSSMLSALGFWKSSGEIWTRSAIVVCKD